MFYNYLILLFNCSYLTDRRYSVNHLIANMSLDTISVKSLKNHALILILPDSSWLDIVSWHEVVSETERGVDDAIDILPETLYVYSKQNVANICDIIKLPFDTSKYHGEYAQPEKGDLGLLPFKGALLYTDTISIVDSMLLSCK